MIRWFNVTISLKSVVLLVFQGQTPVFPRILGHEAGGYANIPSKLFFFHHMFKIQIDKFVIGLVHKIRTRRELITHKPNEFHPKTNW